MAVAYLLEDATDAAARLRSLLGAGTKAEIGNIVAPAILVDRSSGVSWDRWPEDHLKIVE